VDNNIVNGEKQTMNKYLAIYIEKKRWGRQVGMELIEAESLEKAQQKSNPNLKLDWIRQVNDDAKPQDFKPQYVIEIEMKHQETMAKFASNKT
jgi:hypothetical protein